MLLPRNSCNLGIQMLWTRFSLSRVNLKASWSNFIPYRSAITCLPKIETLTDPLQWKRYKQCFILQCHNSKEFWNHKKMAFWLKGKNENSFRKWNNGQTNQINSWTNLIEHQIKVTTYGIFLSKFNHELFNKLMHNQIIPNRYIS